jgi:voltage-gated potassium channel
MHTLKHRVYAVLTVSSRRGDASWYCDMFIIGLIVLNTLAMILDSFEWLHTRYYDVFELFEIVSVVIFSVEYLLRLWTINANPRFAEPFWGNLRYALTPMAVIDLLAVLPFYLPFLGVDLRVVRILRIFRIFRLFKITRYVRALALISDVVRQKREELALSLVFTLFLLLIASSLVYFVEQEAQPDKFSSIPETMWWGIATLTTVGYGDIYPITGLGKFFGGLIAIMGVGLFALPAGILASGFAEAIAASKTSAAPLHSEEQQTQMCSQPLSSSQQVCSHCGQPLK